MFDLQAARSWLPVEYQGRVLRPYYLPGVTPSDIASGSSYTFSYTLQDVAAFLVVALVGRVWASATPATYIQGPALTLDFRFASGDAMTNGAVGWSTIVSSPDNYNAGVGTLVAPRLVSGGSTLQGIVANFAGTAYTIRLDVAGWNVYNS